MKLCQLIQLSKKLEKLIRNLPNNRKIFDTKRETEEDRNWFRNQFEDRFPIEGILNMDLDDYVVGKLKLSRYTNKETFCYGLENTNLEFGKLKGSSAGMFGIYFNKDDNEYKFKKKNLNPLKMHLRR